MRDFLNIFFARLLRGRLAGLALLLALPLGAACAQNLYPADVAFVGYNADYNVGITTGDEFSFIALANLPAGTRITFSNSGYTDATASPANSLQYVGFYVEWQAPAGGTPAGTVVRIRATSQNTSVATSGTITSNTPPSNSTTVAYIALGVGGDQLVAFQGASAVPATGSGGLTLNFVAAIHFYYSTANLNAITGWNNTCAFNTANTSVQYPGLANGQSCAVLADASNNSPDNGKYNGPLTGTACAVRAAINNRANWVFDDTNVYNIDPSGYTVGTITPPPAAPTGNAAQTYPTGSTVASLQATGSNVQWYAAATGGTALASTTALADGSTYYATQTVSNCEGNARLAVTVTLAAPAIAPTVTTAAATALTTTSATLGGNVTADGGATITERGVVYVAGTGTPTTSNTKLTASGTTGSYTVSATGLTAGTLYTVQAYATNSAGTSYGGNQTFTTTQATTAAPVLTSPANGSLIATTTPTYQGTAPANSTVTVSVDGTGIGTTTALAGGSFTLAQPTALAQGTHTVRATAQSSGSTVSANSNTNTFTVDSVPPTVAIGSTAGSSGGPTTTTPIPFTVTFSEAVTGFVAGDVSVTNGTIAGFAGSGTSYSFNVTPTTAGTATTVNVTANVAQDNAGNGNTAAPSAYSLTYAPAPQALTISTGTAASPVAIAAGTYTTITVTGTGYAQLGGAVVVNNSFEVSGTLDTNCQSLTGAASFTLNAGGTLAICDAAGIEATGNTGAVRVSGPRSYSDDASYVYNGPENQLQTGAGLPATVRSLEVKGTNASGTSSPKLILGQPLRIRRELRLTTGYNFILPASTGPGSPVGLTLLSDASGTALVVQNGGQVLGTATMQRYLDPSLNPGLGYRHYSSPVSGNTLADLATATFTPVFNSAYNSSATPGTVAPFPTVFGYDQARLATSPSNFAAFDKGYYSPQATDDMPAGAGFTVNLPGTEKVDFTGQLRAFNYTLNLARNAGATAADAGWQLVGNPYPAPLDWSLVTTADRAGLDASMYVFESTGQYAGSYRSYVNGIGGSPLIGSSQGFIVRVSAGNTSGSLTFAGSQRITSYNQQVPVRRSAADPRPLLALALAGATGPADALTVYAEAGATPGADAEFDAVKLANPSGLNLASLVASGQQLAIDGRPAFAAATSIPLTVGVPAAGTYTLAAAQLANLPAGLTAYLYDAATGSSTALSQGTVYSFQVTAAQAAAPVAGRFTLQFGPSAPLAATSATLAAQVSVFPNPAQEQVTVRVPGIAGASTVQAELLNSLGQVVLRQSAALPAAGTAFVLPTASLAAGVYMLRLAAGATLVAKRLTVQ